MDERATYKVARAVTYALYGMLFAAGTRAVARQTG